MTGIGRDVAYAVRLLRRRPGSRSRRCSRSRWASARTRPSSASRTPRCCGRSRSRTSDDLYAVRWSSTYPDYLAYAERRDLFDGVVAAPADA